MNMTLTNVTFNISEVPSHFARIAALNEIACEVGYANLSFYEGQAALADLYVNDKFKFLWPRFCPVFTRTINYRSQGIGSALLVKAIEYCQHKNYPTLTGILDPNGDRDRLTAFYRRFGFSVNKGFISLVLSPSPNLLHNDVFAYQSRRYTKHYT